jgi:subtilisin family serine protease
MSSKLLSLFFVLFLTSNYSLAQTRDYFIGFTDRNGSTYSLQQPLQFLSQRAIDRRLRQSIPIMDNDLPVNSNYLDSLTARGAILLNSVKWLNGVTVRCDSATLAQLQSLPFVRQSVPVMRLASSGKTVDKRMEEVVPALPQNMLRTQLLDYGLGDRQVRQMNANFLHDQSFLGQGMLIAVFDAGFNSSDIIPAFDNLRNANGILYTWDFVARNSAVYEDDSHGTAVLSCMAADVSGQLIGTAPSAQYILLRTEDANSEFIIEEYNWATAAAFADSAGVDIINSSLGYTEFDDGAMNHTYADMNGNVCPSSIAADVAASKGILVVNSAGNQGNSFWRYISAPADADSILAVGAVDSAGYKASFSSWGPSSDGDIKPNVATMGRRAAVASFDGSYGTSSGTSFSSPVLAGAAACLWQAHPTKTNMEVKRAIEQSANYFNSPGDSLGYGIPNFLNAYLQLGGTTFDLSANDALVSVSPNPFTDELRIAFYAAASQSLHLRLFDMSGRLVAEQSATVTGGTLNALLLTLPTLPPSGVYQLEIQGADTRFLRKVVAVGANR